MKKAYLVFEDGTFFEGESFGADTDSLGELVFTTGMCGYIETLTDGSYCGQIVMQTFPLIGNYGVIEQDFEGKCCVKGYVVRECCDTPSNFRSQYTVDRFLKEHGVPGICGIDTRAVTKMIRDKGVMNAAICHSLPADLKAVASYRISGAVESVTVTKPCFFPANGNKRFNVTLIDYGVKSSIISKLQENGCDVTLVPATFDAKQILDTNPDGIMLSNGPGDPAENTFQISVLSELLGKKPMFGICLGHQLLALAAGGSTEKLKYGHRGVNQPVRRADGKRTFITSQNHGYAVVSESVTKGKISYVNANDGTCEGIDYPEYNAFSVQFHPEAHSGPWDTSFLFGSFLSLMGGDR